MLAKQVEAALSIYANLTKNGGTHVSFQLELSSDLLQKYEFNATADLIFPSLMSENILNFKEVSPNNTKQIFFRIQNPSDWPMFLKVLFIFAFPPFI